MSVLVHKAVEPDKLSVAGKKRFKSLIESIIVGRDGASVWKKYDGVYAQFIFEDKSGWAAFSRTGQRLGSISEDMFDAFYTQALPERRYMGELWLPGIAHQNINGAARRQKPQHLELYLFDSMDTLNDDEPYHERRDYLFAKGVVHVQERVPVGQINVVDDLYDIATALKTRGASAYDGLILRDESGLFIPGAGKGGEIIKIKPRPEGDFRVVGTTAGLGNRAGGIGALVVDVGNGHTTEVGAGLTMKDVFEEASPIGRIATIEYLGVTSGGKLREPSFKVYRHDKFEADVLDFTTQTED